MAGIMIIAHAPLASAMQEFARHVYGEVPERIVALDVMAHEDAKVTLQRATELAQSIMNENGFIVLTDIMGATPANVASRIANLPEFMGKVRVMAGLNLPMLMRTIAYRAENLDSLVQKALYGGQQGILSIGHVNNQQASYEKLKEGQK